MAIYTKDKLKQDILDGVVEYTVNSVSEIKQKEREYIDKLEYKYSYDYHINKTNLNFKQSISALKDCYQKTYDYLISNNPSYQFIMYWVELSSDKLFFSSFFELNQRIYFLTDPSRDYYDWLPSYLKDGWLKAFGGVVLSYSENDINGTMLIGDPYSRWKSFDIYLTNSRKRAKKIIDSLVQKIPYAFIDINIEDIEKQQKHRTKGFPNLRVMIDCRKPYEDPTEYDLILMCYYYDHRMFWVKDGDFVEGLHEIINPQEMLDEYFLHVFSQTGEECTRFDFSQWAKIL